MAEQEPRTGTEYGEWFDIESPDPDLSIQAREVFPKHPDWMYADIIDGEGNVVRRVPLDFEGPSDG